MNVITRHRCMRCGKLWFPRTPATPKICPTCKSINWNKPKKKRTSSSC